MFRVLDISPVNWLVLGFYALNLVRLSLKFRSLYARFPLGATAVTNLLLYGLSDTLAQTLRSAAAFREEAAASALEANTPRNNLYKYVLERGRPRQVWLDEADDDLAELGLVNDETANSGQSDQSSTSPSANVTNPVINSNQIRWEDVKKYVQLNITDFDLRRLVLFSAWGFFVSFLQSPWYKFLRAAYKHDTKIVIVVQRVLADQLFYSPLVLAGFLYYLATVVERKPYTVIRTSEHWQNYLRTLGINLCVWPAAQFVNFLLIPSAAQIPFSSSLSVVWNTYLSLNTR